VVILFLEDFHEINETRIGGKAAGLARLTRAGLDVPAWCVIPADASPDPDALAAALARLGGGPVAVRSSAAGEDGARHSFAGQLDSFLDVDGPAAAAAAVTRVRASAEGTRALAYLRRIGRDGGAPLPVAVVVQRMVDGDVSGVAFSRDPRDPDHVLVSAAPGRCDGVVSGSADADTLHVHRDSLAVRVVDVTGGRAHACLDEARARAVARAVRRAEEVAGTAQDVEWTFAGDTLWLLQSRPITARPREDGRVRLWDNSNIVESYSGVTSPLTYSFARRAYHIVYQQFCAVMGVPADTIRDDESTFQAMIGYLDGRIFYNLHSWYRVLSLLPGFRYNKSFMEQMMGVAEAARYEPPAPPTTAWRRYGVELPHLLRLVLRLGVNLATLPRRIDRFKRDFDRAMAEHDGPHLAALPADHLAEVYRVLERRLLWNWKAPIVNDFFAMIFYGVLRSLVAKWLHEATSGLHNDLLCGEGGMASVEPTREALRIARRIAADPALRAPFDDESIAPAALWRLVHDDARFAPLAASLDAYLRRFGFRCIDELKLEEPTLADDPSFLVVVLRNYLRQSGGVPDPSDLDRRERAVRVEAERRVARAVHNPVRRALLRWVTAHARRHVRDREDLRFARSRVFAVVRTILRGIGRDMADAGRLPRPEDVFYLTLDEVLGYVEGTAPSTAFADLAAVRRRHADAQRAVAVAPPSRLVTRGAVHARTSFAEPPAAAAEAGERLTGIGVSPGRVRARARVIRDPQQGVRLDGQVLVAERTDPGWVPLFPSAGAIAIERGSVLSHSAIVARELGIPTVVGVRGLLDGIPDGAEVELDGGEGWVRVAGP
jgi:pyruvate,water dikinase